MPAECIECDRYPCRCDDRLADFTDLEALADDDEPEACPVCGGELDEDGQCAFEDEEEEEI